MEHVTIRVTVGAIVAWPLSRNLSPLSAKSKEANHHPFSLQGPYLTQIVAISIAYFLAKNEKRATWSFKVHFQNTALFHLLQLYPGLIASAGQNSLALTQGCGLSILNMPGWCSREPPSTSAQSKQLSSLGRTFPAAQKTIICKSSTGHQQLLSSSIWADLLGWQMVPQYFCLLHKNKVFNRLWQNDSGLNIPQKSRACALDISFSGLLSHFDNQMQSEMNYMQVHEYIIST